MKLSVAFCSLALLSESAQAARRGHGPDLQTPETVEIDFEPLGPDDDVMVPGLDSNILAEESPSSRGAEKSRSSQPETGLSEKELDDVLTDMLGSPTEVEKQGPPSLPPGIPAELANAAPQSAEVIVGDGPNGAEILEIDTQDGPPPLMMENGPPGGIPDDMRSSIPVSALKSLFPPGQMIIEEDDGRSGQGAPSDVIVEDMMQEMSNEFQRDLLPIAQQAATDNSLPSSCSKELKAFCKGAKSRLHCLGQHSNDISDVCRADVGGILSCLGKHLKELDGPCRDAVTTTKHVINKVNTQKASVIDPKTGQKKSVTPKSKVSLSQREANLDANFLGLGQDMPATKKEEAVPPPPPPSMPARLLGHPPPPPHHAFSGQKHTPQTSPPFLAVFVPFALLVASAAAVLHFRPVIAAKLMQQNDAKPLNVGTELISSPVHSSPTSYPGRIP